MSATKAHWECSKTKCLFRKTQDNHKLWGVVIQRLTCQEQSSSSKFCFKYIRFMSGEDGSQNSHTVFHEIFWASYSKKNSWTLVRRINITADNMGQDTDLDNHGYPPELPPPSTIFTLPNKFKILDLS